MPFCADTDFLIDLKDQDEWAIKKMEQLQSRGEVMSTTAINIAEFYFGAYRARDKATALSDADKLLEPFAVLSLDSPSAKLYGQLGEKLRSNMMDAADLFIASIAITNKQKLLTRNIRHFARIDNLELESW